MKRIFNRNYTYMLVGYVLISIGTAIYSFAIEKWVLQTTGSTSRLGIINSVSSFTAVFLSPLAGVIADSLSRKKMIILCDLLKGTVLMGVAALAFTDRLNVGILVVSTVLTSVCSLLRSLSASSLNIDFMDREDVVQARSIVDTLTSLASVLSLACSGFISRFFGVKWMIFINGLTALLSAAAMSCVTDAVSQNERKKVSIKGVADDLVEGFRYSFSTDVLSVIIIVVILGNLCAGFGSIQYVYFVNDLNMGEVGYGLFTSINSFVSMLGMATLSVFRIRKKNLLKPTMAMFVIQLIFVSAAMLINSTYITALMYLMGTFLNGLGNSLLSGVMVQYMPDDKRSSVTGIFQTACSIGAALSMLVFGYLGDVMTHNILAFGGFMLSLIPFAYGYVYFSKKEDHI